MKQDFHQLAAVEMGRINRRIFADPDIYQQELERIFARAQRVDPEEGSGNEH